MSALAQDARHWFHQAAALPTAHRREFLDEHCPDPALRAEVHSLLAFDTGTLGHVQHAIGTALKPTAPASRVGSFELGALLGSGGMGLVYEAHRIDGEVRQRAAIKFAQVTPTASEELRQQTHRRFCRERQMLASLNHPYIAGLIDAGSTADGTPYAVIEQVDGQPIDAYCDQHHYDTRQRIRLFLQLCEAVQFAHRHLIVHSDLKPDNVLVTAGGIPKLIDFGIATHLDPSATLTLPRGFTPAYAGPEQSRGLAATVATDVYGLGALLYRLVTGAPPRDVQGRPLSEVLHLILEEDVVRPRHRRPDLDTDLENILLKALHRDPQRRYGSVPELADDLQRYLRRRPVRATPDSAAYRCRRFLRRHWLIMTATLSLAVALFTVAGVAIHERELALRRALASRQVASRLLFDVHDEIAGVAGATKAREKLSAIAVEYLDNLERGDPHHPELAWERLNAYARLAQNRGGAAASVGDTASALTLARKALAAGTDVEAGPLTPARRDRLFTAYESLLYVFQQSSQAELQRATIERMLRLAPQLAPLRQAQAYKDMARYFDKTGAGRESERAFAHAARLLHVLAAEPGHAPEVDSQLVSVLAGLARSQALAGNFPAALATYRETIARAQARTAADPHDAKSARQLYWSHIGFGDLLGSPARFSLGRRREAVAEYQQAQHLAEQLMRADPGNEVAKLDVARALSRQGQALANLAPAQALDHLETARTLAASVSPRNLAGVEAQFSDLVTSVDALVRLNRLDAATQATTTARRLWDQLRAKSYPVSEASLLRAEALRLAAAGDLPAALATAQRQLALYNDRPSPVPSENFAQLDALTRITRYAATLDPAAATTAAQRRARIWQTLRE